VEHPDVAWQAVTGLGAIWFVLARLRVRELDIRAFDGFGVWHGVPRWIRVLFGGFGDRVRIDFLLGQLTGVVFLVSGCLGWAYAPTAKSDLFAVLLLAVTLAVAIPVFALAIVSLRRGK
jgi:hypothetical protein